MSALLILALLSTPTQSTSEWGTFLGFSQDERLAAWRHDFHRPLSDGSIDQFSIIETVDTHGGYRVATFRASAIHRIDSTGRPVKISRARLLADNPAFAEAYPSRRWNKLERRSRFGADRVAMTPEVFVVAPDDDVEGSGQAERHKVTMAAAPGSPLGFSAVARDVDGERKVVGHFRQEGADARTIAAELRAFTSRSGNIMAVFTLFLVRDGPQAHGAVAVEIARLETPLASPKPFERAAPVRPTVAQKPRRKKAGETWRDRLPRPTLRLDDEPTAAPTTDDTEQAVAANEYPSPDDVPDPWKMRAGVNSNNGTLAAYKKMTGADPTAADKREIKKMQAVYDWFVGGRPKKAKRH